MSRSKKKTPAWVKPTIEGSAIPERKVNAVVAYYRKDFQDRRERKARKLAKVERKLSRQED